MRRAGGVGLKPAAAQDGVSAAIFTSLVLHHRKEITHPRPTTAVDMAWRLTFAAVVQQVMFDNEEVSGASMATKPLVREITRWIVGNPSLQTLS